jgi:outer membrane receptor protein involved in Fe transport
MLLAPLLGTPLLLLTAAQPLPAQEASGPQLEEVIVTAQKREESLRDVPISVDAVAGEKLAEAGIARLDDLKSYVPNLQVTETGIANNFYVRGIGSGLNHGFEQSVSIYSDGIYRGRGHQSRMPFLDLERIEVLRGPQPILFGKNAVAGAVNLTSARPTDEFYGSIRGAVEFETDERLGDLVLSGPFGDTFGARVAVRYRETDGYQKNLTLNRDEPARDELGGRLTLAFEPSDAFDATLKIEGGSFDVLGRQVEMFDARPATAGTFTGLTYPQILANVFGQHPSVLNADIDYNRSSNGDFSELDSEEAAFTMNFRVGSLTLTSVSGYSAYDLAEGCDCDFNGGNVFTATIAEDFEQLSQELRLTSPVDQRVAWIAGLFYQEYDLVEEDTVQFPTNSVAVPLVAQLAGAPTAAAFAGSQNPRVFTQDSELYAVFAQATFNVTDRFRMTGGARWSSEDKTGSRVTRIADASGTTLNHPGVNAVYLNLLGIQAHALPDATNSGERSEDFVSPLVNVQWDISDDTMTYVSWVRGNKAGGFDARSNRAPPVGTFQFEDEEATSYELGVKTGIRGVAELSAAVFFTDYEDLQTSAFDGRLGFTVGNGSAEIRGVEVAGRWQATQNLFLGGSIAYLDFEWTKYDGQCFFGRPPDSTRVPGNCNYDGFDNQLAPELTGMLTADYAWPIGGSLALHTVLDVLYSDEYLQSLTLDPRAVQEAYTKLNARVALGAKDRRWEVALVGRNLTDEDTVSYAGDVPLSGSIFGAPAFYGFVDLPRTLALEGSFRF